MSYEQTSILSQGNGQKKWGTKTRYSEYGQILERNGYVFLKDGD
ncbi:hypothetical protein [Fictibacillus sp. WQ 8-8]|nr:hypothetical protein [Fictibacillus sp. WQ 8-8]